MEKKVVDVSCKLIQERRYFLEHIWFFQNQKYSKKTVSFCPQVEVEMRENSRKMIEMLNSQNKGLDFSPVREGPTGIFIIPSASHIESFILEDFKYEQK